MALATARTIDVLEALGNSLQPLSMAEIVALTGIGRASAGRLLASMIEGGAVLSEGEPPRYRLGLRCWSLGMGAVRQHPVVATALPHLIELCRSLMTRINVAVPEGLDAVYLQSVEPVGARLTVERTYTRTPLLATASGRVLAAFSSEEAIRRLGEFGLPKLTPHTRPAAEVLAELPEVRARGYATIDREHDPEFSGVAVPIRDRSGAAVAAVGLPVVGPLSPEFLSGVLRPVLEVAANVSVEMGLPLRQTRPLA